MEEKKGFSFKNYLSMEDAAPGRSAPMSAGVGTDNIREVVIVDIAIPFSSIMMLLFKILLALIPFCLVIGAAAYFTFKYFPF